MWLTSILELLPFAGLVVMITAPFPPCDPYKAVAPGPLSMLTLAMSSMFTAFLFVMVPSTT